MATREERIGLNRDMPAIACHPGVDSLGYLSLEGPPQAVEQENERYCLACLTGEYPHAA